MIKGLNFQPWISDNYESKDNPYGKLLILGESHYYEEDDEEEQKDINDDVLSSMCSEIEPNNYFTSAVVKDFIDAKHNVPFFNNLGLLFNPNDKYHIWKNVAFANGIQFALDSAKKQPTKEEIATVKEAFWLLLDNLNPDKILVCSKRMWNNWLPDDSERGQFKYEIQNNNKNSTIWEYQLNNKGCTAMGINHPSKYFSYNNWRPIVFEFLDL